MRHSVITLLLALVAAPVAAQEARPLCADRPGIGTPACTLDPGRVVVELGVVDWTRERGGGVRSDTVIAGDLLLRVGIGETTEVQLGWTSYGRVRERSAGALVGRASGTGDVLLSLRQNLASPDGSGRSAAVQPYVTLPVGGDAIGAGDWGAGVLVPIGWELSDRIALALTPQVDAAVDADGDGRHFGFGTVLGIDIALSDRLSSAIEFGAGRDDDPAGRTTPLLAALALALQIGENAQVDMGGVAGLNRDAPDLQLYAGFARRF